MSSAQRRRLMKDELEKATANIPSLNNNGGEEDSDSEEEEEEQVFQVQRNPFDFLDDGNDGMDDDDDDDDNEEHLGQSSKVDSPEKSKSIPEPSDQPVISSSSKKKKKKKKKGKGKQVLPQPSVDKSSNENSDEDEIDKSLRELNEKYGQEFESTSSKNIAPLSSSKKGLLTIDPKQLDPEAEMRKMFGSKAINAVLERNDTNNRRRNNNANKVRSLLSKPNDGWPRLGPQGLSMEYNSSSNMFTFVHSKGYQSVQKRFLDSIATHQPQYITALLQEHPYHIDSLLQLSEVSRHSGDIRVASSLIERALFAFEKSLHVSFNLSTGQCRLDFTRVESRPFYLALFRHVLYVSKRGCWKTTFEFSKLLFSLDPQSDPYGILLTLDFFAVKAGAYEWLLRFRESKEFKSQLDTLPNWHYSTALSLYHTTGANGNATTVLSDAIKKYPNLVIKLLEKLGEVIPTTLYSSAMDSDVLNALSDLYVEKNVSLWKVPDVLSFLKSTIQSLGIVDQPPISGPFKWLTLLPVNFQRYVFCSDLQSSITQGVISTAGNISSHDPFVPKNSVRSVYDEYLENRGMGGSNPFANMNAIQGFLQSLINPGAVGANGGEDGNDNVGGLQRQLVEAAAAEGRGGIPAEWMDTVRDALAQLGLVGDDGNNHNNLDDQDDADEDHDDDDDQQ